MNYLKLLLKLVQANPQLLISVLEMLVNTLKANPALAAEIIQELQPKP